jgi:hypothetical protein
VKKLYQGQAAEADFKWQVQYGNVIRFQGVFGVCNGMCTCGAQFLIVDSQEDQLMISDPAALQYMFVKSGYRFATQENRQVLSEIVHGKGVTSADGMFFTTGMRQPVINV